MQRRRERQAGLKLGRREMQKTPSRALREGCVDAFPDRAVEAGNDLIGDHANVEMAVGIEEKLNGHGWIVGPDLGEVHQTRNGRVDSMLYYSPLRVAPTRAARPDPIC